MLGLPPREHSSERVERGGVGRLAPELYGCSLLYGRTVPDGRYSAPSRNLYPPAFMWGGRESVPSDLLSHHLAIIS